MEDLGPRGVAVVGGGLTGSLLAVYLRARGYDVDLFENRADIRADTALAGRSINLVLTSRGIAALAEVGLAERMLKITVPVYGRTMHSVAGELTYQPYGPDDTYCNYSVSRARLNQELLSAAERAGAKLHFQHGLDHLDVKEGVLYSYVGGGHPRQVSVRARHVFGTDGGGSRCRQALKGVLGESMSDVGAPLGCGYKELFMPACPDGSYPMDVRSLHIWPRGNHFLMALANLDGSFTMTLYMPSTGPLSFKSLGRDPARIRAYFEEYYADAIPLMPDYLEEYLANPDGFLGTVYASPWYYQDKLMLVGDAAHAITPFFGQGCNAGFEDVKTLDKKMREYGADNVHGAFAANDREYKENADAIAQMALENYIEMMDKTGDPAFLLQKEIEIKLAKVFPKYVSRYAMVTHTLIPYAACLKVGEVQETILRDLARVVHSADEVDMDLAKELVSDRLYPCLERLGITEMDLIDSTQELLGRRSKL